MWVISISSREIGRFFSAVLHSHVFEQHYYLFRVLCDYSFWFYCLALQLTMRWTLVSVLEVIERLKTSKTSRNQCQLFFAILRMTCQLNMKVLPVCLCSICISLTWSKNWLRKIQFYFRAYSPNSSHRRMFIKYIKQKSKSLSRFFLIFRKWESAYWFYDWRAKVRML